MTRRAGAAICVLVALVLALLARGLPARAFYVGDPGVKLIAARNAIAHPSRPFDVDLPRAGGAPAPFVDPFFRVHGDHAHAITSGLFPLLTAPFLAWFGLRGIYLLPALGFLGAILGTASAGVAIARRGAGTSARPYTDATPALADTTGTGPFADTARTQARVPVAGAGERRRSAVLIALVAALCTPLVFYALEFWEHAPAVGIAAMATAVLFSSATRRRAFAAGALFGLAILLRPEAVWYAVALLAAGPLFPDRIGFRRATAMASTMIAVVGIAAAATVALGGDAGGHIVTNLSGAMHDWEAQRAAILRAWIAPGAQVATVLLLAVVAAAGTTPGGASAAVAIAAVVAIIAAVRDLPVATILASSPAVVALAGLRRKSMSPGAPALAFVTVIYAVFVFITAPNDGGGQWGPRYLLFAAIPIAILLSDLIAASWREARPAGAIAVVALLAACAMVQRNAYKELQAGKRTYDRLVTGIEANVPAGSAIVTDVWWLDQVAAALSGSRTFLVVDGADAARRVLAAAERDASRNVSDGSDARHVFIVRSDLESHGPVADWLSGTTLGIRRQIPLDVRSLTLSDLEPAH